MGEFIVSHKYTNLYTVWKIVDSIVAYSLKWLILLFYNYSDIEIQNVTMTWSFNSEGREKGIYIYIYIYVYNSGGETPFEEQETEIG
jgi:hypothetical protein